MTDTKIQPKHDYVLCRLLKAPKRTASGLHIPDQAKPESIGRARILACGPEVKRCSPGDVAVIGEARAYTILETVREGDEDKAKQYILLQEVGVIAIDHGYKEADGDEAEVRPMSVVIQ